MSVRLGRVIVNTIGHVMIFALFCRVFLYDTISVDTKIILTYILIGLAIVATLLYYTQLVPARKNSKKKKVNFDNCSSDFSKLLSIVSYYAHTIISCVFLGYLFILVALTMSGYEVGGLAYMTFLFTWGIYIGSCLTNIFKRVLNRYGIADKELEEF